MDFSHSDTQSLHRIEEFTLLLHQLNQSRKPTSVSAEGCWRVILKQCILVILVTHHRKKVNHYILHCSLQVWMAHWSDLLDHRFLSSSTSQNYQELVRCLTDVLRNLFFLAFLQEDYLMELVSCNPPTVKDMTHPLAVEQGYCEYPKSCQALWETLDTSRCFSW